MASYPIISKLIRLGVLDTSIIMGEAPAVRSRARVRPPRVRVITVVGLVIYKIF